VRRAVLALAIVASLAGCANVPIRTPSQTIYAALGSYKAAVSGAAAYVAQPTASPAAIRKVYAVKSDPKLRTALGYARAYVACQAKPVGVATDVDSGKPVDCTLFDFTSNTAFGYAATINSVVTGLLQATGGVK
jgi:hypothetical protein